MFANKREASRGNTQDAFLYNVLHLMTQKQL